MQGLGWTTILLLVGWTVLLVGAFWVFSRKINSRQRALARRVKKLAEENKRLVNQKLLRQKKIRELLQPEATPSAPSLPPRREAVPTALQVEELLEQDVADGLYYWGRLPGSRAPQSTPKRVKGLNDVREIAVGGGHALVTANGELYQLGNIGESVSHQTGFHLVRSFVLAKALRQQRVVSVSCGELHSIVVTDGGTFSWGDGSMGQLGHGGTANCSTPRVIQYFSDIGDRVTLVKCGGVHSIALAESGAVFSFGSGRAGRLGLGSEANQCRPRRVRGLEGLAVCGISCGYNFSLAWSQTGDAYTWGCGTSGQLGHDIAVNRLVPTLVKKLKSLNVRVVMAACGYFHTLVLSPSNRMYSWGLGESGELGARVVQSHLPTKVSLPSRLADAVVSIAAGRFHSVALTAGGKTFSWGRNSQSQLGLGDLKDRSVPELVKDVPIGLCAANAAAGADFTLLSTTSVFRSTPGRDSGAPTAPSFPERPLSRDESFASLHKAFATELPRPAVAQTEFEKLQLWERELLPKVFAASTFDWHHYTALRLPKQVLTPWRKGVPEILRASLWPQAIGNSLKITPSLFACLRHRAKYLCQSQRDEGFTLTRQRSRSIQSLSPATDPSHSLSRESTVTLIDVDLPRTFPRLKLFGKGHVHSETLREALETFAVYRPDIGYVQGMSYVCANLCLHVSTGSPLDAYTVFTCLSNLLLSEHMYVFYRVDNQHMTRLFTLFEQAIQADQPSVAARLNSLQITPNLYLFKWLQTLFLSCIPMQPAARVWDCYLVGGVVHLVKTALAVLRVFRPRILSSAFEEVVALLSCSPTHEGYWQTLVTEKALFRALPMVHLEDTVLQSLIELRHALPNSVVDENAAFGGAERAEGPAVDEPEDEDLTVCRGFKAASLLSDEPTKARARLPVGGEDWCWIDEKSTQKV